MIRLISVTNPFQPTISRTESEVEWREGMTISDVLAAAGHAEVRHTCVHDGMAVPEEMFAGYLVPDGATLVVMPRVGGGGWIKMFAEIAVMVAAAAITAGVGAGLVATAWTAIGLGGVTMGTALSVTGALVAVGGNMLVNALMGSAGSSNNSSATFDPTGPKTVASGNTPIQKGYGKFRSGGTVIASYVSADGPDNYINVLTCHGFGQAVSVGNILINGNPIGDYTATSYQVRLGTNNQAPIPYFNNVVNGYPQDARFKAIAAGGTPLVITGTGSQTQGLRVVTQFPNGVYFQNDDGSLRSLAVSYLVEYSVSGQNNWQSGIRPDPSHSSALITYDANGTITAYPPAWVVVPSDYGYASGLVYAADYTGSHTAGDPWTGSIPVKYTNADGSTSTNSQAVSGTWQPFDGNLNQELVGQFLSGYTIMTAADTGCLYQTVAIDNLPPNKYDVRLTKYGAAFAGDAIQAREPDASSTGMATWLHAINEVQYQDLAYPNMILVGVRALATNQLSGSNFNVTADITYACNASLPTALASYSHDNPALVAYDMLVDSLYGGGVDPSQIDVPAFAAWAAFSDEMVSDGFGGTIKRHVFNGVFDQSGTNLWKALQKVALMSSASILQIGRNYTVVIDAPVAVPAQIFTSANIARDSIKDTWLALDDRANRVEVTFPDAARNYRTDEPCAVMLPADIQAGVEAKPTRIQLLGCTNRAQAWHWAYRKLRTTDTLLLTRSFDVGLEAIACQVGSVIGVQDDVTGWANGGRIQAGSTASSLIVDVDNLTFAAGSGWTVSVLHPVVTRGTGTIQTLAGNVATFATALPAGRIVSIDNAAGATGVIEASGTNSITLASATGFAAGQAVAFYDQEVIDTQPVSALVGNVITPAAPFIQDPTPDCPWVYGQSAGAFPAKLFTVTGIRRKGDEHFTIDCIQYDASVYSDDTPLISQTLGTPDVNAAVTNLLVNEIYGINAGANGGQASTVAVGWQNGPNTAATQIWVARNEVNQPLSAEVLVQTITKGTTCSLTYPTGSILQIRAVGVDGNGSPAPYASAPVETITVQGSGLAPGDVSGFAGNFQVTQTIFNWNAVTGAANYEIRYNPDPSNTDWLAGQLLWSGSATTWADSTIRGGLYMIKSLSATDVESIRPASFSLKQSSSYLNSLGLAPSQTITANVGLNNYDSGTGLCSVTIAWPAQTLYRTDGTTVSLPLGSLQWNTALSPATTYYFYLRLRLSDMTMHSAKGDPPTIPDTSPNPVTALQSAADGYYTGPSFSLTTPSSSGSGGTGGSTSVCPDSRELVVTRERGGVPAGSVQVGEHVLGRGAKGEDCWKRVKLRKSAQASAWYRVNGYRVSPLDPVFVGGEWRRPYEVGTIDIGPGERAYIGVDEGDYDSQNYYLVGRGERLLMHNWNIPAQPGNC